MYFVKWYDKTLNTPYKAGLTSASYGYAIVYALQKNYINFFVMASGDDRIFTQVLSSGTWNDWKVK